jgi:hypothetical protein
MILSDSKLCFKYFEAFEGEGQVFTNLMSVWFYKMLVVKAKYGDQPDAQAILGYLEIMNNIKNCDQPEVGKKLHEKLTAFHLLILHLIHICRWLGYLLSERTGTSNNN